MLSFEFSVFDLVLSVCVMVLIVLFVTTLLKLNPSKENEQSQREVYEKEQESALFQRQPSVPPVSWQSAERTTPQKTQRMPQLVVGATADGTSQESLEEIPPPSEIREPPKQPKTTTSTKQTSKSAVDKDCLHHFGYLNGLPKNTPIPGECFGCPKIVDCLITAKER